jgi:transposase InsO family protein
LYVETLEDALAHRDRPDIFNTDSGSQFAGSAFTSTLAHPSLRFHTARPPNPVDRTTGPNFSRLL